MRLCLLFVLSFRNYLGGYLGYRLGQVLLAVLNITVSTICLRPWSSALFHAKREVHPEGPEH